MIVNERIKKIRERFCSDSNKEFAKKMGVAPNVVNNYVRNGYSVGQGVLYKILDKFPEVDKDWLLTGKGEMLKIQYSKPPAISKEEIYLVPLLPISAQGGSLNDFVVSVKDSDCERVVSPIKGADFAITVTGDSMSPEYPNGSLILIKKINEKAFIDWGKTYVLDTCNGTVIKTLVPSNKKEFVKCTSINPDPKYAPFEVSLEDVYGIYRIMMCMSIK